MCVAAAQPVVGPVLYVAYVTTVLFVVFTILIAIISDAYNDSKDVTPNSKGVVSSTCPSPIPWRVTIHGWTFCTCVMQVVSLIRKTRGLIEWGNEDIAKAKSVEEELGALHQMLARQEQLLLRLAEDRGIRTNRPQSVFEFHNLPQCKDACDL